MGSPGSPKLALSYEDLCALLDGTQPLPEGGMVTFSGRLTLKQVRAAGASPCFAPDSNPAGARGCRCCLVGRGPLHWRRPRPAGGVVSPAAPPAQPPSCGVWSLPPGDRPGAGDPGQHGCAMPQAARLRAGRRHGAAALQRHCVQHVAGVAGSARQLHFGQVECRWHIAAVARLQTPHSACSCMAVAGAVAGEPREPCCPPEPEPAALPRSLLPMPACSSPAGMGAAYLANALRNHNSTLLACDLRGGCCGTLQSSSQQGRWGAHNTVVGELTAVGNAGCWLLAGPHATPLSFPPLALCCLMQCLLRLCAAGNPAVVDGAEQLAEIGRLLLVRRTVPAGRRAGAGAGVDLRAACSCSAIPNRPSPCLSMVAAQQGGAGRAHAAGHLAPGQPCAGALWAVGQSIAHCEFLAAVDACICRRCSRVASLAAVS